MSDKTRDEEIVFRGHLVEIVHTPNPSDPNKYFEFARRGPGTRLMFVRDGQMLVTREYRHELSAYDLRLPGGKVFDSLAEYEAAIGRGSPIVDLAEAGAMREASEEVGLRPSALEFWHRSVCGATVTWDLYFFVCRSWDAVGAHPEEGEDIEAQWLSFADVRRAALDGSMSEDRAALQVLRFISHETTQ